MKKYLFIAVAAIVALSSCSNDNDFEQSQTSKLVFTATMEGNADSRATYDSTDKCASWEVGDQIYVFSYDANNNIKQGIYSAKSSGTTSTFTFNTGDVVEGEEYQAMFPAYLIAENGDVVLPSAITEEYGKFNMPMYAMSKTTELQFKNICGVLAVTVPSSEMTSVKSIKVSSKNLPTSGKVYDIHNNSVVLANQSSTNLGTVTVTYTEAVSTTNGNKTFYVAIPPTVNNVSTYKDLKIEVSDGTTTKSMTTKKTDGITIERSKIYPITFNYNSAPAPEGALSGKFNVSDTKQVYFAKGNLYYDGSAFQLEENQYDIATSWSASHVSNFFWSKDAAQAYAASYDQKTATSINDVFFTNADGFTVNGQTGVWRTLSNDEWNYLFEHYAYKYTTVCNKPGLVIAPTSDATTIADSYDTTAWTTAEANGFVFLPNTGYRPGTYIDETYKSCLYWSSTLTTTNDGVKPYRKFFQWNGTKLSENFNDATLCNWGIGIRLVADVK